MKLLIATFNKGKLRDYKDFLKEGSAEVISLKDLNIKEEFEEVRNTFEENAKAKAEFYAKLTGLPTLADDSGIEIPFYNMRSGVKTKRWAQNNNLDFIVRKIKEIPKRKRQAQLRAVLALNINNQPYVAEGTILGTLTETPYQKTATHGYPWDQVFIINDLNKYYEELTEQENYQYNHRGLALEKFKHFWN